MSHAVLGQSLNLLRSILTILLTCANSDREYHKPIRIYRYVEGLILGINTLYMLFYFFKLFPVVGKGLINGYSLQFNFSH